MAIIGFSLFTITEEKTEGDIFLPGKTILIGPRILLEYVDLKSKNDTPFSKGCTVGRAGLTLNSSGISFEDILFVSKGSMIDEAAFGGAIQLARSMDVGMDDIGIEDCDGFGGFGFNCGGFCGILRGAGIG